MRDRLLNGLVDGVIGAVLALKWALIGAFAVPFVWGWIVVVQTMLSWLF